MEASKLVPKDLDAATALPSRLSCLLQCLVGLADIGLELLKGLTEAKFCASK